MAIRVLFPRFHSFYIDTVQSSRLRLRAFEKTMGLGPTSKLTKLFFADEDIKSMIELNWNQIIVEFYGVVSNHYF